MTRKNQKKKKRSEHELSLTIASSMSEIVKFSLDDDFRKRSFAALGVSSTKDVENEIYLRLVACTVKPESLFPQTVTFDNVDNVDNVNENQSIQKTSQTNLSQSLSQSGKECEVFSEGNPDLSETIFSQMCSQISQEQEERRIRQKNLILSTHSEIITPQIYEILFSKSI